MSRSENKNQSKPSAPVPPAPSVAASAAPSDPSSPVLLRTSDLAKQYRGRRVVDGVAIEVKAGEIVGLIGPNGAGKTTTFNIVVGLVRPDSGQVIFQGEDVTNLPMHQRARRGMGYLTQEPSVFRKLTVEQNILAILETLKLDSQERKIRLKYLMEELDLTSLAKSKAYQLSGGEKRRLEVTRAMVTSPKLLMLDEPFSGIDPIAIYEVQKILRRLKETRPGHFDYRPCSTRNTQTGGSRLPDSPWQSYL